jgi:hypothetical protein
MPPKMTMQIARHSYNPAVQTWGIVPNPTSYRAQIVRPSSEAAGGLNNMAMINRVRFSKSGCSSCGGSK